MELKSLFKKGLLFGLVSLLFSLIISILVGEFIVKHIFPQDTYGLARLVGLHFFQDGGNIPFTFQKNVKNFHHIAYTHEFDHFVNTNSWGTRGKEFSGSKAPDTYRILFLGDSMTFGWGVNDNENYPYLVEENLNKLAKLKGLKTKFEVINAGFADGLTLDSYYVYLQENGSKFNPDLVVVDLFPYNDFSDLVEMKWEKVDKNGYPVKIISEKQKVVDGYLSKRVKTNWKFEIPILRNSHLAILLFNAMERGAPQTVEKIKKLLGVVEEKDPFTLEARLNCVYSLNPEKCPQILQDNIQRSKFLLTGFKQLAKKNNWDLLVTIMVSPDQALPLGKKEDKDSLLLTTQPQKYFRDFLTSEGITVLDLLPTLSQKEAESFFYTRDGHLGKKGHEQVTNSLVEFLVKKYISKS